MTLAPRRAHVLGVAAIAAVGAILLAGCGSSKPKPSSGEAAKPASRILKDAQHAASAARSVHATGHGVQGGQKISLDLSIAVGRGAAGSFTLYGGSLDVIRLGPNIYLRGDRAFWQRVGSNGVKLSLLINRWVEAPASAPSFSGFTGLMSMSGFTSRFAVPGKVVNEGVKTFQGQQVIALQDPSEHGTLYVSATGKPYPVALVGGKSAVTLTFDHWNQSVSLPNAPKHALRVLGG